MMVKPCDFVASLHVGSVVFISPNEIKIHLDIESPDSVALNAGTPRAFPRINSYLLIPADNGFLVGQVLWITVENSPYPKRKGLQDFGLIDLPFPLRKLSLSPLGILRYDNNKKYVFTRGIESFPSIGDEAILPTNEQLKAIVQSGENKLRVKIGTSPLGGNADVFIDPDKLFGRHLAVLGNTGSGKSCSVAGLIQWSLNAANSIVRKDNQSKASSRFIILDPNGEYGKTFASIPNTEVYSVKPSSETIKQLKMPIWFWNTDEWCAFARASDKTQRPLISQTLQALRAGVRDVVVSDSVKMRQYLRTLMVALKNDITTGTPWSSKIGQIIGFRDRVKIWSSDIVVKDSFSDDEKKSINALVDSFSAFLSGNTSQWPHAFSEREVEVLEEAIYHCYTSFGGGASDCLLIDPDVPKSFSANDFLDALSANAMVLNIADYVETMTLRIRSMLSDSKVKEFGDTDGSYNLKSWLESFLGDNNKRSKIVVVDLSLIPSTIVHIVTASIARMVMESLQRYRKCNDGNVLPTVLVVEEAHTFIKRYTEDYAEQGMGNVCCKVFEKIAREGRKFGLGLVLSSQRPSELSPTVLSQCNTFLLHRISNDRDQDLIHRLLPDNLQGLLHDLPILPSRHAVLLGWASELPVLVRMNELPKEQRPQSDDPDFWDVWTGERECDMDWKRIEEDWIGVEAEVVEQDRQLPPLSDNDY